MIKQLNLSDDCLLQADVRESGIPGILTLDLLRCFPHAQRPRWQNELQINASPCQLWEMGAFLMEAAKPHKKA